MDDRFSEPRGWALRWEGTALCPAVGCTSQQDDAPAVSGAWLPQWQQVTAAPKTALGNGNGRDGLGRPRGWALQWDGSGLTESADGQSLAHLRAVELENAGAA